MGEVWRAFDTATDRVVAVKVLPEHLSHDEVFQQRFRREARAAAGLNSPHVIPIHNHGEIDGRLYVDMRLIEGRDLHAALTAGPLEPGRAVRIIEQVARALRVAHKAGLVHRDVKPSNILLDEDDFAYLIDFGIARAAGETRLTGTGGFIGSYHYMAPERFSAKEADARADVYALACVLYECLTGQKPYPGDSLEQQYVGHVATPPPRPSNTNPNVPAEFDQVIDKGLAKDPEQRYTTTVELARAARDAAPSPIPRRRAPPPTAESRSGAPPTVIDTGATQAPPAAPPSAQYQPTDAVVSTPSKEPASAAVVVGEIPRPPQGFVVRDTVQRVADTLGAAEVAAVCALTGLRGVGKTQVAAAYARSRVAAGDGLVGWVNAESRDDLLAGLARIAQRVGVGDPDGDSLNSAKRLREHLETRADASLVVFDNATDPDGLVEFLPAAGPTRVVITSTDRAFTELGREVNVAVFSRAESVDYLSQRTDIDDPIGAAAVAEQLGDLPVALAQAAATIRGQQLTYQRYLQRLGSVAVAKMLGTGAGQAYRQATAAALLLSIETTESQDPSGVAGMLLRVVSVLSPQGVSRDLLATLDLADVDEPGEGVLDAALEHCVRGSLLSWSVGGDSVIMHRLVGRVLRESDRAGDRWTTTVATALDLLESHLFDQSEAWAQRDLGSELVSQIEALWEVAAVDPPDPDIMARELRARSWAVRQLCTAADLNRAIALGLRVAADSERVLGAEHPDTLTSRNYIANAYHAAGRLAEAIALYERTLADRERILGAEHPHTLASRNNLAIAYASAGRLAEAIALHERTLADRERILGAEHPQTLLSRNNLANAYQDAGRLAEAIALHERTLTDYERVLGAEHPHTLHSRNNLAGAYRQVGRVAEAIALHERTLTDRERILGAEHPDTLRSRNNIAIAYQSVGRLVEAIALYERILTDTERILGAEHPDTLHQRNNLASAYQAAGRLPEAIALLEGTLTDRERILGAEHPDTVTSRSNLADAYQEVGRLAEAIPLFEGTLADRERILGAEHPDTVQSRNDLADAYHAAGRVAKAIPQCEREDG
ncbi:MAG: tetratricopeptide repeat protein [Mycobacterium sp.]